MTLYIGTSGWAYKEWKPGFYPADIPQSRFLEHYGTVLSACEVNATFYRTQAPETLDKWGSATPDDFKFSTKAHRALTAAKNIVPDERKKEFLRDFGRSVSRLGDKLGIVLFQFPAFIERDDKALRAFLSAADGIPAFACDFTSPTWDHPEVEELVAAAGGTVCLSETEGVAPKQLPPGPVGYMRMRSQHYDDTERARLREMLTQDGARRDVYAFAKHEGIPTPSEYGGVGLARWLARAQE